MRKMRVIVMALLTGIAVVALGGCRTAPVHNVTEAPVNTGSQAASMAEVREAIIQAGTKLGWQMNADSPGHIIATLNIRSHMAQVDVNYDTTDYSIEYRDSRNLKYDGNEIHKNYNGWIQNLDNNIRQELLLL
ncbi:hypothetical protein [Arhodomonas sp. AD133]|uniref:hypothetical protein n=1 Tax=Arhodomonas sp. AD133 TaxID=3415009 RepID=UPI003EB921CE